jgi:hypothetical protein
VEVLLPTVSSILKRGAELDGVSSFIMTIPNYSKFDVDENECFFVRLLFNGQTFDHPLFIHFSFFFVHMIHMHAFYPSPKNIYNVNGV